MKEEGPPQQWTFEADDFRRGEILAHEDTGNESTVDVAMSTDNNPLPGEAHVHVAGTLRLHYEWSVDRWNLREIENVSFRYSLGPADGA
jgi:hypothetical protein